jgi:hypothetical protein
MEWVPLVALAALVISLGFAIWQFTDHSRKTPTESGPSQTLEEGKRKIDLDDE